MGSLDKAASSPCPETNTAIGLHFSDGKDKNHTQEIKVKKDLIPTASKAGTGVISKAMPSWHKGNT
jgi:hypothetical protein